MKQIQQFQEQQAGWQQLPQDERTTNENQVESKWFNIIIFVSVSSICCIEKYTQKNYIFFQKYGFRFQYQHTGRLARYHNIMGLETIQVLDKLTSEIRSVFLHPTMVDRIAAMLNYFLKNLVGPERKSFKVKKTFFSQSKV